VYDRYIDSYRKKFAEQVPLYFYELLCVSFMLAIQFDCDVELICHRNSLP
jgi:hypothetical protein